MSGEDRHPTGEIKDGRLQRGRNAADEPGLQGGGIVTARVFLIHEAANRNQLGPFIVGPQQRRCDRDRVEINAVGGGDVERQDQARPVGTQNAIHFGHKVARRRLP